MIVQGAGKQPTVTTADLKAMLKQLAGLTKPQILTAANRLNQPISERTVRAARNHHRASARTARILRTIADQKASERR